MASTDFLSSSSSSSSSSPSSSSLNHGGILSASLSKLDPRLNKLDKVRRILKNVDAFKLPSIVVIGDQSAGKSSLLESLSNVQLPRKSGTCTKCPLEIRLRKVANKEDEKVIISADDVAEKEIEFERVGDEIEELSNSLTSDQLYIFVDKTIYLEVRATGVPSLTLVDMPGYTQQVPDKQDASKLLRVDNILENMIRKKIEPKEVIICNVITANDDFGNSACLRWSNEIDPDGARTLIVCTKSDKEEPAVLASRIQNDGHRCIGIVAVVNRNDKQLNEGVDIDEIRRKEAEWFKAKDFIGMEDSLGTPCLASLLTRIQSDFIEEHIPCLHDTASKELARIEDELSRLPETVQTDQQAQKMFLQQMAALHATFVRLTKGDEPEPELLSLVQPSITTTSTLSTTSSPSSLSSSSSSEPDFHVSHIISRSIHAHTESVSASLSSSSQILSEPGLGSLRQQMLNFKTIGLANFLSTALFKKLMGLEFDKLKGPADALNVNVNRYLLKVLQSLLSAYLRDWPPLRTRMSNALERLLAVKMKEGKCVIERMLKTERDYLATENHQFMDTFNKLKEQLSSKKKKVTESSNSAESDDENEQVDEEYSLNSLLKMVTNDEQAVTEMAFSLIAYIKVVQDLWIDMVPRALFSIYLNDLCHELRELTPVVATSAPTSSSSSSSPPSSSSSSLLSSSTSSSFSSGSKFRPCANVIEDIKYLPLMQDVKVSKNREQLEHMKIKIEQALEELGSAL